jgi:predicted HTH domain antitoxin
MSITISDDVLKEAGLSERDALIEFACRLFDAGKLHLPAAAKLAGLDRASFEGELRARKISVYRPTVEDLRHDLDSLRRMGI